MPPALCSALNEVMVIGGSARNASAACRTRARSWAAGSTSGAGPDCAREGAAAQTHAASAKAASLKTVVMGIPFAWVV